MHWSGAICLFDCLVRLNPVRVVFDVEPLIWMRVADSGAVYMSRNIVYRSRFYTSNNWLRVNSAVVIETQWILEAVCFRRPDTTSMRIVVRNFVVWPLVSQQLCIRTRHKRSVDRRQTVVVVPRRNQFEVNVLWGDDDLSNSRSSSYSDLRHDLSLCSTLVRNVGGAVIVIFI